MKTFVVVIKKVDKHVDIKLECHGREGSATHSPDSRFTESYQRFKI